MRALSVAFILCSVVILAFLLSGNCPDSQTLQCSIVGLLMAINGVFSCAIYVDRG